MTLKTTALNLLIINKFIIYVRIGGIVFKIRQTTVTSFHFERLKNYKHFV
jgi:hypothetical protein